MKRKAAVYEENWIFNKRWRLPELKCDYAWCCKNIVPDGKHLAALGAPLVERPHEGFLVACVLVRRLEHRRSCRLVVYGDEAVAGILERPARAGLTMDHAIVNTNERDRHNFFLLILKYRRPRHRRGQNA